MTTQDYYDDTSGKTPRYYQLVAINRTIEAIARATREAQEQANRIEQARLAESTKAKTLVLVYAPRLQGRRPKIAVERDMSVD